MISLVSVQSLDSGLAVSVKDLDFTAMVTRTAHFIAMRDAG